ncbi:MAG: alkaline shock response membrane anchor protein AmaP [Candidatus Omnitrophica bacterium]|nr:alkaline shock response membrane anchor protein AmaP [Candidatus Omnitrophota bacterium]
MNGIINIIIYLITLIVGITLVVISLGIIEPETITNYLKNVVLSDIYLRIDIFLLGILLLFIVLRALQIIFNHLFKEKKITAITQNGEVSITLKALEDIVRKCLENENISQTKTRIISAKKKIDVEVILSLKSKTNLSDFTYELQEKIKNELQGILGTDKEIKIKIEVKKISFPKEETLSSEEKEGPFRYY